jgi:hypothetical protein
MDCDFLVFGDIAELWALRDSKYAVQVCKHSNETFKAGKKFLGAEQTVYERKCWSSLMLFNCEHPSTKRLAPGVVNDADGLWLHQLRWCQDPEIGDLPLEWNWLVSHYPHKDNVQAVHYTEGGPYFKDYRNCDYSLEWWKAFGRMKYVQDGLT